ncbi:CocE/NonD family hydrolase C-terminal non-catalytic domain-containing protein, partial [Staphylococcus aureus]
GTLFTQGETLEVVVKGSEIVIGNSNTGMKTHYEHEETVHKGMNMIYTGGKYDSQLFIPIVN